MFKYFKILWVYISFSSVVEAKKDRDLLVHIFVSPAPGTVPGPISVHEMISHPVFTLCKTDGYEGHSLILFLASLLWTLPNKK